MRRPEINALQQHLQLLRVDLTARLFARSRPGKAVLLQALLPLCEASCYAKKVGESAQSRVEFDLLGTITSHNISGSAHQIRIA
jgi:hypothetical protein